MKKVEEKAEAQLDFFPCKRGFFHFLPPSSPLQSSHWQPGRPVCFSPNKENADECKNCLPVLLSFHPLFFLCCSRNFTFLSFFFSFTFCLWNSTWTAPLLWLASWLEGSFQQVKLWLAAVGFCWSHLSFNTSRCLSQLCAGAALERADADSTQRSSSYRLLVWEGEVKGRGLRMGNINKWRLFPRNQQYAYMKLL